MTLVVLKLYPTSTDYILPCKRGNLFVCILSAYICVFVFPANTFDLAIGLLFLGFHEEIALLSLQLIFFSILRTFVTTIFAACTSSFCAD